MSPTDELIECKLGKRDWHLLLADAAQPEAAWTARVASDLDDAADLLLIGGAAEELRALWEQWLPGAHAGWSARWVDVSACAELSKATAGRALAIGPHRRLDRFASALGEEPALDSSTSPVAMGEMPKLPLPWELPTFPEGERCDPFGQSAALRRAAWTNLARRAGRCVADAHRLGLAFSLPSPPRGEADPELKPWRTLVPVREELAEEVFFPDDAVEERLPNGVPQKVGGGLDFLQRYLLTLAGQQSIRAAEMDWTDAAEALEEIGYLLVTLSIDIESLESLAWTFEIGAYGARLHSVKFLHGDMHLGNFGMTPERDGKKPELGGRVLTWDVGDSCVLTRLPTAMERAQDLTILKSQVDFLHWEAAKLGYRFMAGDLADEVFRLFPETL